MSHHVFSALTSFARDDHDSKLRVTHRHTGSTRVASLKNNYIMIKTSQ